MTSHWPSDRLGGEMKKKAKTCLWTERMPDAYFPECGKGLGWSGFGKTPGRAMFKFCPSCGLKIRHVRLGGKRIKTEVTK